jgi:hypothetical protein
MTPNPRRMGAVAGACICAIGGKVDIDIDIDIGNCISRSAVNPSQRRPWL